MNYSFQNLKIKSIILIILTYVVSYTFFSVFFEDGDDIVIQQIIQGAASGKPDEHLVFINIIIGYILKPLYEINNQIYWYSLMLVLFQSVSLVVITNYLFLKNIKWYFILSLLFFFLYFVIHLQFTSVSGLLAIAGMLIFNNALILNSKKLYILSFVFLIFSMLLRLEMFLLTSVICFSFLLIENKLKYYVLISNKFFFYFFLFFLFIAIFCFWFNLKSYQNEKEWKYYYEYNLARGKLNDNPNCWALINELEKKNILESSELNLAKWFIYPGSYDLKKLIELQDKMKPNTKRKLINNYSFIYKGVTFKDENSSSVFLGIIFLFLIIFLSIKSKLYLQVIPILFFFFFFIYINFEHTFKARVFYPIILAFVILNMLSKNQNLIKFKSVGLILLTFYTLSYPYIVYPNSKIKLNELIELPKNQFIVLLSPLTFSSHPFKLNKQNNCNNLIEKGWMTNSPLIIDKLNNNGLKVSQHLSLIDNDILNENVLYHIKDNPFLFKRLNTYLSFKNKKLEQTKFNSNLYRIIKNDTIQ